MEMSPTLDFRTFNRKGMEGYPYNREGEDMGSAENGFEFGEYTSLGMENG